jgi:DNA-directed RNA polymerase omega subunit
MSKINIEDLISKVRDRFELVILSSTRASQLNRGLPSIINLKNKNQKNIVTALYEIAYNYLDISGRRKTTIKHKFVRCIQYMEIYHAD